MLRLRRFEYLEPTQIRDASRLLRDGNAEVAALGAGTDLLVRLKHQVVPLTTLVSLRRALTDRGVCLTPTGGLEIGAMTPLADIASADVVRERFQALATGARRVATPQIRNAATLGGNLCQDSRCWYINRSPSWRAATGPCLKVGGDVCHLIPGGRRCLALFLGDLAPALIALDARAELCEGRETWSVPLASMYSRDGEHPNVLRPGQILTRVTVPAPVAETGSAYLKFASRQAPDYPLAGVAVRVTSGATGNGPVEARLALIGCRPAPVRLRRAEAALAAEGATERGVNAAAETAARESRPVPSRGLSAPYLRAVVRALVRRAILEASGRSEVARAGSS